MVNPGDTVVVSRAGIVYILGDVNRPGGYVMSNNESQLTLLQGLALAGSATRAAKQGHAHLIRQSQEAGLLTRSFLLATFRRENSQTWPYCPVTYFTCRSPLHETSRQLAPSLLLPPPLGRQFMQFLSLPGRLGKRSVHEGYGL